jgi:hypothetical protein
VDAPVWVGAGGEKRRQLSKTFKAKNQKAAEKMFNAWVVEMQENYRSQR